MRHIEPVSGLAREWYFTPGPTQLHPSVPEALRTAIEEGLASESHRGAAFRTRLSEAVVALRALLDVPSGHRIVFLGSATEAMERIVQGSVRNYSVHLVNGAFSRRFHTVAQALGKRTDMIEVAPGRGFDLDTVQIPGDAELVAVTQNETSTGVVLDAAAIGRLADRSAGAFLAVDSVTALPAEPLDLSGVDACFFSVQKLFGCPAGLGVLIVSPALVEWAREFQASGHSIGGYLHLAALAEKADRSETVATPNVLAIHLLGVVARDYLRRGRTEIRTATRESAERLMGASARAGWTPFVDSPVDRSRTILVFDLPEDAAGVRERLRAQGFRVGTGYGVRKERQIRIANFPVHPPEAVDALAKAIEAL